MDIRKRIGENIKQIRKAKGMSQEDVAYPSNISLSNISNIERGAHDCKIGTLEKIAEVLGVPTCHLVSQQFRIIEGQAVCMPEKERESHAE